MTPSTTHLLDDLTDYVSCQRDPPPPPAALLGVARYVAENDGVLRFSSLDDEEEEEEELPWYKLAVQWWYPEGRDVVFIRRRLVRRLSLLVAVCTEYPVDSHSDRRLRGRVREDVLTTLPDALSILFPDDVEENPELFRCVSDVVTTCMRRFRSTSDPRSATERIEMREIRIGLLSRFGRWNDHFVQEVRNILKRDIWWDDDEIRFFRDLFRCGPCPSSTTVTSWIQAGAGIEYGPPTTAAVVEKRLALLSGGHPTYVERWIHTNVESDEDRTTTALRELFLVAVANDHVRSVEMLIASSVGSSVTTNGIDEIRYTNRDLGQVSPSVGVTSSLLSGAYVRFTLLCVACTIGTSVRMIQVLVDEGGADPGALDGSPLYCACEKGHTRVASTLLENHGASIDACRGHVVVAALENKHWDTAAYLVTTLRLSHVGAHRVTKDQTLKYAAMHGRPDLIRVLLDAGARPYVSSQRSVDLAMKRVHRKLSPPRGVISMTRQADDRHLREGESAAYTRHTDMGALRLLLDSRHNSYWRALGSDVVHYTSQIMCALPFLGTCCCFGCCFCYYGCGMCSSFFEEEDGDGDHSRNSPLPRNDALEEDDESDLLFDCFVDSVCCCRSALLLAISPAFPRLTETCVRGSWTFDLSRHVNRRSGRIMCE